MIDLDYTANTPADERVLARFCEVERLCIGNANSKHAAGRQAAALDARGVCVSVKSACSVEGTPSRAVFAVSRNRARAMNSIRISLSHLTTEEEIAEFLAIFKTCYEEMTK